MQSMGQLSVQIPQIKQRRIIDGEIGDPKNPFLPSARSLPI